MAFPPRAVWLLALLGVLGACASRAPIAPVPELSASPPPGVRDDAIVGFYNGEPLFWRAVAEKVLELEPKAAIDQYVRWRLIEDRRQALGIQNEPYELERRSELYLKQSRRVLGEEAFRLKLEREGLTEEAYRRKLAGSRLLAEMLTLDKIVRYQAYREDSLEIDRMVFAAEADARRFWELCQSRGFDRAAEEFPQDPLHRKIGRLPREIFPRSLPPLDPPLDPSILADLLKLGPGEHTGVETSKSNLYYVVKLGAFRKGRDLPYREAQSEVFESVLRDPPRPEEYARWIGQELARSKIEYADESARKEKRP